MSGWVPLGATSRRRRRGSPSHWAQRPSRQNSRILGNIELLSLIGRGGMSEVWKGIDRQKGTAVALKIACSPKRARLLALSEEARLLTQLEHPAIIKIFDYGCLEQNLKTHHSDYPRGCPYLIMELAEHSIYPYCGQIEWPLLLRILLSLLDALDYIHQLGLVHCDIKPGNLLISKDFRYVKLADFGIASSFEEPPPPKDTRNLVGTPTYMSPEQFRGQCCEYGPWTDLYAFGCAVYELVSGEPPFGRRRFVEAVRESHLNSPPPPLPPKTNVPPGLQGWIQKMMAKDPARRFQRASLAAEGLTEVVTEQSQAGWTLPDLSLHFATPAILREGLELALLPTLVATQTLNTLSTTLDSPPPTLEDLLEEDL